MRNLKIYTPEYISFPVNDSSYFFPLLSHASSHGLIYSLLIMYFLSS